MSASQAQQARGSKSLGWNAGLRGGETTIELEGDIEGRLEMNIDGRNNYREPVWTSNKRIKPRLYHCLKILRPQCLKGRSILMQLWKK